MSMAGINEKTLKEYGAPILYDKLAKDIEALRAQQRQLEKRFPNLHLDNGVGHHHVLPVVGKRLVSEETRKKLKAAAQKKWQDPKFRKKQMKARSGKAAEPTAE